MPEGSYLSVTLDNLPDPIAILLEGNTDQALKDESRAILECLGGWCDAEIVVIKREYRLLPVGDQDGDDSPIRRLRRCKR